MGKARVTPASRSFLLRVPGDATLAAGEYSVRSSLRATGGGPVQGDTTRLSIPKAGQAALPGQPMLFRRGPFTVLRSCRQRTRASAGRSA